MALKLFIASPHGTGKTTTAHALADRHSATYIGWKMSNSHIPYGCHGPFIIDELSRQSLDLQQWVLARLLHDDFYLFCDYSDLSNIYPPLQRYLQHCYPEAFL
jgi:MoxR-like ATPase